MDLLSSNKLHNLRCAGPGPPSQELGEGDLAIVILVHDDDGRLNFGGPHHRSEGLSVCCRFSSSFDREEREQKEGSKQASKQAKGTTGQTTAGLGLGLAKRGQQDEPFRGLLITTALRRRLQRTTVYVRQKTSTGGQQKSATTSTLA